MHKGTFEITNIGESVISAGYIQKTIKEDLHVRVNYANLPRNRRGKVLDDTKRYHTAMDPKKLSGRASQPHHDATRPPVGTAVSPLLECSSTAS
jgi:hypothetical protein